MNTLDYFLPTTLTFRKVDHVTGTISEVTRLAANGNEPLRFSKVIKGSHSRLITHENIILQTINDSLPTARVVKRYSDTNLTTDPKHPIREIITHNAGVDIDKWYSLSVNIQIDSQQLVYPCIFCHPVVLLRFTLHTLQAFWQIHKVGIFHCDIKQDQICIPFGLQTSKGSHTITPDFTNITLIDFGNALWERVHIYKDVNPLPFNVSKAKPYQASKLIQASKNQFEHFNQHGEYSFSQALKDVDYSVDLYSFGYLLDGMVTKVISPNISFNDPLSGEWMVFLSEYKILINELLSYQQGIIRGYGVGNLPHAGYIQRVQTWLDKIAHNHPDKLTFGIVSANEISTYHRQFVNSNWQPQKIDTPVVEHTPLVEEKIDILDNRNKTLIRERKDGNLDFIGTYIGLIVIGMLPIAFVELLGKNFLGFCVLFYTLLFIIIIRRLLKNSVAR